MAQPIREVLLSPSPILVSKASIDGKVAFSTAEVFASLLISCFFFFSLIPCLSYHPYTNFLLKGLYLMDKNRVSIRQLSSLSIFRDMAWSPAESLFVSTAEGSIQVFSGIPSPLFPSPPLSSPLLPPLSRRPSLCDQLPSFDYSIILWNIKFIYLDEW